MAKPRVFISSTFYDLRHVRGELERFVRDMGYEPVLNERGNIAYGSSEALERYCYKEVEKVSMLVSIVGNRFGAQSIQNPDYSISNMEMKAAIKQGRQVYVFVDTGVLSEYRTYLKNKDRDISYHHVDDPRVFRFLEEIHSLPFNNQVAGFSSIPELIAYLKEQWAGLFEMHLQQSAQERIFELTDTIQSTAETLKSLVEMLKNERLGLQSSVDVREQALDAIIIQNHPIFNRIRSIMSVKHRVFFTNVHELEEWLTSRGWSSVEVEHWASIEQREYHRFFGDIKERYILYVSNKLFDERGFLKAMMPNDWSDKYAVVRKMAKVTGDLDDEIPF